MDPQAAIIYDLAKARSRHTGTTLNSEITRRTHGLMIDAGSGGSRMHVFEWEPRMFDVIPPPISYPSSRNRWTRRLKPGLSTLVGKGKKQVWKHLAPLIEFAKDVLKGKEEGECVGILCGTDIFLFGSFIVVAIITVGCWSSATIDDLMKSWGVSMMV